MGPHRENGYLISLFLFLQKRKKAKKCMDNPHVDDQQYTAFLRVRVKLSNNKDTGHSMFISAKIIIIEVMVAKI
jgi:hypothetical protein